MGYETRYTLAWSVQPEFAEEHRARMKTDLKAVIADLMAARLAKVLPEPETLK